TETESEPMTETTAPQNAFTSDYGSYKAEAAVPEDLKQTLEGAKFVAVEKTRDDAQTLAESLSGAGTIAAVQTYDLHFEKNGVEVPIENRAAKDIAVTLTFPTALFADQEADTLKVYHIKADNTAEEVSALPVAAAAGGFSAVSFNTDGFSDYVLAATKSPEETVGRTLTINLSTAGASEDQGYELTITGVKPEDWNAAENSVDVFFGDGASVKTTNAVYTDGVLVLTAPAGTTSVRLTNLSQWGDATKTVPQIYTIDAHGNTIDENNVVTYDPAVAYTVLYNEKDYLPISGLELAEDATVSIKKIYTVLNVNVTDAYDDETDLSDLAIRVRTRVRGTTTNISDATVNGASGSIKGLPIARYTLGLTKIPSTYVSPAKAPAKSTRLTAEKAEATVNFEITPLTVVIEAVDKDGKVIEDATFTIKRNGKVIKKKVESGEPLIGLLQRNKSYTIIQEKRAPYYRNMKEVKYKVLNQKDEQTVTIENEPTLLKIDVTGPDDTPLSGAAFEIRTEDGKVIKDGAVAQMNGNHVELEGVIDLGVKYQLVQTAAPVGYYMSDPIPFALKEDGSGVATIQVKNEAVKITISRKGFDDHSTTIRNRQGYDKNGYLNMKMLAGAELEVQDLNGNVIESWVSSSSAGYTITGKLEAGTKYRVVEKKSPTGYAAAKSAVFETPKTPKERSIALATRKSSSTIQVTKRVTYDGKAIKLTATYYCALFTDAARTKMYREGGVKPLQMNSRTVYAVATFTNVPAGTYYVAETDRNGKVINGSEGTEKFSIKISNEQLRLSSSPLIAEIVNEYQKAPQTGYSYVDPEELKKSYSQQYANFGGSASAAASLASGPVTNDSTVVPRTGDQTPIMMFVGVFAAAVILLAAAITLLLLRRRKK
ncbi:MAG: SpaA isopeptide-forming pilin-related protein, partial [Eubacteriales bacterium]|nr:SpaA isopeptide-forming pilin-related protein [Eubacteriales bacterium]